MVDGCGKQAASLSLLAVPEVSMKTALGRCVSLVRMIGVFFALTTVSGAQLNENCTVSILNRTAQVRPDGTWRIDNVPTGFGPVRARATCVENGVTRSGQS